MKVALVIILLAGIALSAFLLYAGIKGLKTYRFPSKEERDTQRRELQAKAHELYLKREAEKKERKRQKKYCQQYNGSIIIDVLQGKC